jgi:hypothetical protein
MARGSAGEIRGALDLAEAWGWQVESAHARALLDRELGLCVGTHPPQPHEMIEASSVTAVARPRASRSLRRPRTASRAARSQGQRRE